MKKSTMMFLLAAILLMGSISAHAGISGTLTLTGVGSNVATGTNWATYPYFFNLDVNNTITSVILMCDDQTDDVYMNEAWNVTINTMTDIINSEDMGSEVGQMNPSTGLSGVTGNGVTGTGLNNGLDAVQRAYADAAYMFLNGGLVDGASSADVITNEAVWELFADKGQTNPFGASDQAQINALFAAAQNFTSTLTQGQAETDFSNIQFYSPTCSGTYRNGNPDCGQPSADGRPQEFIGDTPVPEPGTLALLATGLIVSGVTIRRRKRACGV